MRFCPAMPSHRFGLGFAWLTAGVLLALATGLLTAEAPPRRIGEDRLKLDLYDELEIFALQQMDAENIPGLAIATVENGQVTYAKGFGVRQAGGDQPVNAHTLFEIGSTSKAFTVALMAMLEEEGRIGWTDRVTSHLPGFRLFDGWVTQEFMVEDLFCQRSGMPAYSLDDMSALGFDRADIIAALRHVAPVTSARSRFAYVNNLFLAGARIIELKTGLGWEDNLDRRIFGPLEMTETTTNRELVRQMGNFSSGHWVLDGPTLWVEPEDWRYRDWLRVYGPAGGIYSNVLDMALWLRAQLGQTEVAGKPFLQPGSLTYMHSPKILASPGMNGHTACYASGWIFHAFAPVPIVWHNGGTTGQHSMVALFPSAGAGIVVLTNTNSNQAAEQIAFRFYDLLMGNPVEAQNPPAWDELAGVQFQAGHFFRPAGLKSARPENPGPPLPFDRYEGRYRNPAYGVFEVRAIAGTLYCLMGPKAVPAILAPLSGNTFELIWPDYPGKSSLATFEVGAGENAHRLLVDMFADAAGGAFQRVP